MLKAIAIYLGILVTSGLTWFDYIGQIFTKARKLVDMMYKIFVLYNLPYQYNRTSTFHFIRPFAHTNDMYHSFVPSVIWFWNNLRDSAKLFHSISWLKRSLFYHFDENVYIILALATFMIPL